MSCVVCNYSTHDDCTLIVLSTDPEMMLLSLNSTAHTPFSCPFRVALRVISVGDMISHKATALSCRSKHTLHSNDNDTVQIHVEPVLISMYYIPILCLVAVILQQHVSIV